MRYLYSFAVKLTYHSICTIVQMILKQKYTLAIGFEIEITSFNIGPRGKKELHAAILPYPALGLFSHGLNIPVHHIENNIDVEAEKLDFYYAKNQNIWLDLEILGRTLNKMWSKRD